MQQRYYDPAIGRFLSVDPVGAGPGSGANFNRYWYADNNPFKFVDPDGRMIMNPSAHLEPGSKRTKSVSCEPYCLDDDPYDYNGSGREESFVRSVAHQFRGQTYEKCALICDGEGGLQLSEIKTNGSHIGCDTSTHQCPTGTAPISDIHSHPKEGKITLNAIDVIFRRKGKVGQTLNLRRDQARNSAKKIGR